MDFIQSFASWADDPGFAGSIVSAIVGAAVVLIGLRVERTNAENSLRAQLIGNDLAASKARIIEISSHYFAQLYTLREALSHRDHAGARDVLMAMVRLNFQLQIEVDQDEGPFYHSFHKATFVLARKVAGCFDSGRDEEEVLADIEETGLDIDILTNIITSWVRERPTDDFTEALKHYGKHTRFEQHLYDSLDSYLDPLE